MPEILLLQGSDPTFRLAAWVLREEGYTVRVVTRPGRPPETSTHNPPDICILNADVGSQEGRALVQALLSLKQGSSSVHLAGDSAHTQDECGCDLCLPPPHNALTLLAAVGSVLTGE